MTYRQKIAGEVLMKDLLLGCPAPASFQGRKGARGREDHPEEKKAIKPEHDGKITILSKKGEKK